MTWALVLELVGLDSTRRAAVLLVQTLSQAKSCVGSSGRLLLGVLSVRCLARVGVDVNYQCDFWLFCSGLFLYSHSLDDRCKGPAKVMGEDD